MMPWPPGFVVAMIAVAIIAAALFGASVSAAWILSRFDRDTTTAATPTTPRTAPMNPETQHTTPAAMTQSRYDAIWAAARAIHKTRCEWCDRGDPCPNRGPAGDQRAAEAAIDAAHRYLTQEGRDLERQRIIGAIGRELASFFTLSEIREWE